jgi:uncharacterized protein
MQYLQRISAHRHFGHGCPAFEDAQMTQPAKVQEPSMEEILASIRRIIADEEASEAALRTPALHASSISTSRDIDAGADTRDMAAPGQFRPAVTQPEPAEPVVIEMDRSDTQSDENGRTDVRHGGDRDLARFAAGDARDRPLLSDSAAAAVNSAFGTLAHTVLVQNGRTLEDLVREMLRPLLKSWLDDNLPILVERLVRAEIERVSRGQPG